MDECRAARQVDSQDMNLLPDSAPGKNVQMIEFLRPHPLLLLTGILILVTALLECAWALPSRRRSRQWERQRNKSVQALITRLTAEDITGDAASKSESLDSRVAGRK
jgi:hypothetical protein